MDERESFAIDARTSVWYKTIKTGKQNEENQAAGLDLGVLKSNKKPRKRSIGVGDGPVCSPLRYSFWYCFLKRFKENRSEALTKNSEDHDTFSIALQREGNILKKEILSSTIASILSTLISHPLAVITSKYLSIHQGRNEAYFLWGRPRISFVAINLIKTKGWMGLYKGHKVSQCDSLAQVISMFLTYEHAFKSAQNIDWLKLHPSLVHFSAGFISAIIPVMILHPSEAFRVRQRWILKLRRNLDPIYTKNVSTSIFHGCLSLFMHMGIQYGLRFLFYNEIRDKLVSLSPTHEKATSTSPNVSSVDSILTLSHCQLLFAGGVAAILSDILTHPFSVIHARLMMSALRRQQYKFEQTCRRFGQCFKLIVRNEGFLALYAGILPQAISSMVNIAMQFAVYDEAKHWFRPIFPS